MQGFNPDHTREWNSLRKTSCQYVDTFLHLLLCAKLIHLVPAPTWTERFAFDAQLSYCVLGLNSTLFSVDLEITIYPYCCQNVVEQL